MNSAHQTWCNVQVALSSVNLLSRLQFFSQHSSVCSKQCPRSRCHSQSQWTVTTTVTSSDPTMRPVIFTSTLPVRSIRSFFCCTLLACHEGRGRSPSLSEIGEKTDFLTFQLIAKMFNKLNNNANKLINAEVELDQRPRTCGYSRLIAPYPSVARMSRGFFRDTTDGESAIKINSISLLLHHPAPTNSPSDLQWLINVDALPSAISVDIFIHQLELLHCDDAVTDQPSAVHSKNLVTVQFYLWVNQVLGSEGQLNSTSTALKVSL